MHRGNGKEETYNAGRKGSEGNGQEWWERGRGLDGWGYGMLGTMMSEGETWCDVWDLDGETVWRWQSGVTDGELGGGNEDLG
jgi:hypothetical protein